MWTSPATPSCIKKGGMRGARSAPPLDSPQAIRFAFIALHGLLLLEKREGMSSTLILF